MKVLLLDNAVQDQLDAMDWYDLQRPGLSASFRGAVQQTLHRIAEFPQGSPILLRDFRATRLNRFPYRVVYRIEGDVVRVYAISHTSRDLRNLAGRLPR